jgi:hypothetical protein
MKETLAALFEFLDALRGRASVRDLAAKRGGADISCEDVADHIRFWDRGYARNLVRSGAWYHVLVLCWKPRFPL